METKKFLVHFKVYFRLSVKTLGSIRPFLPSSLEFLVKEGTSDKTPTTS